MWSRHGLDQRVAARAIWKKADSDEDVLAAWAGGRWETGFTAFAMGGLAPSASSVVGVGRVRSSQLAAQCWAAHAIGSLLAVLLACETAIAYCGPDETGDPLASHATHSHFHRLGLPRALLPGCMRLYIAASMPSFTTLLSPPTTLQTRLSGSASCHSPSATRSIHARSYVHTIQAYTTLHYTTCACTCTTPSTVKQKESNPSNTKKKATIQTTTSTMEFSPALSMHSDISDMTDEELDKYFASCVPLSNLPTPPPAKEPTPARPSTPTRNKTFQTSQTSQASTTPPSDVTACPTQLGQYSPSRLCFFFCTALSVLSKRSYPVPLA